ncbi:MAG: cobalamin-binding protein [Candidatus Acidiferrales bacterium]
MRIVSLLPSATEILFALGLEDSVHGVTHECDFPPAAARKPALIQPRLDPAASPAEVDRRVTELISRGESIYAVRDDLLREIAPDLIITQDLCHVCAASPGDLASALAKLPKQPRVLSLTPHTLADVWDDIRRVGAATGTEDAAEKLASILHERVNAIRAATSRARPFPRVGCIEWLDPLYCGGHWVPEMVGCAGGCDVIGIPGKPSFRITMEQLIAAKPEVVVVMVCGYDVARAVREFRAAPPPRGWSELPAVQNGAVFAADANSYFSRPGPRLIDGIAILARMFHPALNIADIPARSYEPLMLGRARAAEHL